MEPNERDADPPSPDPTESEWVDPWSWRAYPDEPTQGDALAESARRAPDVPAADAGAAPDENASPDPDSESPRDPHPDPEPESAREARPEPDPAPEPEASPLGEGSPEGEEPPEPREPAEPEGTPELEQPPIEAVAEASEPTVAEDPAGAAEPASETVPAEEDAADATESAGGLERNAPEDASEPAGSDKPARAARPPASADQAEPADSEVRPKAQAAEAGVVVDEPVVGPEWVEPVGPSDWDERIRLLERVEPGPPADVREPADFWDAGDPAEAAALGEAPAPLGREATEPGPGSSAGPSAGVESADTLEFPPVETPAALAPPAWPPEPGPVRPAPPASRPGETAPGVPRPGPAGSPGSRPERPPRPSSWPAPPPIPPRPLPPGAGQARPPAPPLVRPWPPALPPPGPPGPAPPRALQPRPARPAGSARPGGSDSPWGLAPPPVPARPARTRRRGWLIALAILVALVIMAVQLVQLGVLRRPETAPSAPPGSQLRGGAPSPSGPGASASPLSPQAQVVRLLASRADALLRHDKAAFLATVDRGRRTFYRAQAVLFDHMATVPFASFSYTVPDPLRDIGSDRARQRYAPTVVSVFPVEATFGFRGQDASPFLARYYYTFAVTDSGWRIAGQDDVPQPLRSDVEIWDGGPVQTVSSSRTLVVFHPGGSNLARRLLTVAERGYAQVTATWSGKWDKRVVILVPRDQREAQRLVRSRSLTDVAAVTSSAIEAGPLHRLLGNRIIVNTSLVKSYRTLDLQVVLTHEMTHVATRAIGVGVPLYLVEGFADYTALRPLGAPLRVTRPTLALAVRAGRFTGKLPSRSQLVGNDAALAYDQGSTFCLWVAITFGEAKAQALYRSFGDLSTDATRQDEDRRFRRVLGLSRATAEGRWAAFVRGSM